MANRATRSVDNLNQSTAQQTKANDAGFSVIFARVVNFSSKAFKHLDRIFEIQTPIGEGTFSFYWIKADTHILL